MSDLTLNSNGDLLLDDGTLVLNEGIDSIIQHLKIRLKFFLGEWFLDETAGIPYFQQIFATKNPQLSLINAIFSREILNTPGVIALENLVFDYDNRTRSLSVTFSAVTTDGILDFNEEIGV